MTRPIHEIGSDNPPRAAEVEPPASTLVIPAGGSADTAPDARVRIAFEVHQAKLFDAIVTVGDSGQSVGLCLAGVLLGGRCDIFDAVKLSVYGITASPASDTGTRVEAGEVRIPREPTQAMMDAGLYHSSHDTEWSDCNAMWKAMFDAVTLDGGSSTHALTSPATATGGVRDHAGSVREALSEAVGALQPFADADEGDAEDEDHQMVWPTFKVGDLRRAVSAIKQGIAALHPVDRRAPGSTGSTLDLEGPTL